jgi:anti-sigma B factor antagonist
MHYSVQKVDQSVVFMLEGKLLNEQQTGTLRERITAELIGGHKKFIFDLKGIEFVNSACLNFLVSAKNKISEQEGELVLCNISDQLKRLLQMTRLETFFKTAGRTADAIQILNQPVS